MPGIGCPVVMSSTIWLKEMGYGAGGSVLEVEVDAGIMLSKAEGSLASSGRTDCRDLTWVDVPLVGGAEEI